jgi:hypothetical protein
MKIEIDPSGLSASIDGQDYILLPRSQSVPKPLSDLKWSDIQVTAHVVMPDGKRAVITGRSADAPVFTYQREDDQVFGSFGVHSGLAGWKLLRPALPLFNQLTPGCCVQLPGGAVRRIRSVELRRFSNSTDTNWYCTWYLGTTSAQYEQFTDADLVGAELVPDWPEVTG